CSRGGRIARISPRVQKKIRVNSCNSWQKNLDILFPIRFMSNKTLSATPTRQLDDWLTIEPDGRITIFSGKVELGTGVSTALAQIAAEELDVPLASIHLVMGDTGRTPDEGHTTGSKTIQI